MANLQQEYTDMKDVKHSVEHLAIPEQRDADREQIVRELVTVLTGVCLKTEERPDFGSRRRKPQEGPAPDGDF